ncbi:MAG: valine--tRNA ligase [Candidatus Doudnabacteria bacterium]|nr:valine--tRNA ligase [Candidatus Doudnabacteria bacterium]
MLDLPKAYDQSKESDIYKLWELSGYFNPDNLSGDPFTIIMPPANANGKLHVGHALFLTLEDLMIRFERMRGKKTLWLPGTDHAGFETQVVFEKKLEKEGRSRFKMTREDFYKEVMSFVQENKHFSEEGMRGLGASADWSRNTFSLDEGIIKIVYQTFKHMIEDGLIYRGNRICNWCVKHQTGLADLETIYEEKSDPLYYITYGPFTLATVRPETKFGDTAIAVNPNDERYKEYVGKEIEAEGLLGNFKLKVIADDAVDMAFGTGVVKVTPAHDPADFEIWQRHKDEIPEPIQVIDNLGKMDLSAFKDKPNAAKYHGLKVKDARKLIVQDLSQAGLIVKIDESYKHNVQLCYKCNNVIEPLIVPQWYVAMTKPVNGKSSLRDMAVEAVKSGQIKIIPERQEKIYMHWMGNLKDWAISRQIWWGIPIPVKYCQECNETIIDIENKVEDCPKCGSKKLEVDPDTFDTWFSSGQWPYAALISKSEEDFKTYYPTDIMETGYDIIFFWVSRMIMFGLYLAGKIPFKTVYLHGLVRDKDRQKMSKSKGNVIDPLEVVGKYGVDALRMALLVGNLPGNDLPLSEDKVRGYRNFANKIWNASRFVLQNTHDYKSSGAELNDEDKKIVDEVNTLAEQTTKLLKENDYAHPAENLYHFFWHRFADEIIESSKPKLENPDTRQSVQKMLIEILEIQLKLLHPFVPFVTEAVWQLAHKQLLMIEPWPIKK